MRVLFVIACTIVVWARGVCAASVVVVHPSSASAQVTEVITLLHGELSSVTLDDAIVERPPEGSPGETDLRNWFEQLAVERGAFAVIDIVGDDTANAVDVWVRKSPGRFEVTRVTVESGTPNTSARLAIRAIEALRASLAEVDLAARYRRSERKNQPVAIPAQRQAKPREAPTTSERIGIELGASVLMSPGDVGPALLPLVRLDWAAHPSIVLQATVAGLGSHPRVTSTGGTASVTREYAVVGGYYRIRADRPLWPLFSLAAGSIHTSVEGSAGSVMDAHAVDQWSFLADVGIGAALRICRSYQLTLSGHAQLTHPYVAIHLGDQATATTGRPNLLLDLAVGAWQ